MTQRTRRTIDKLAAATVLPIIAGSAGVALAATTNEPEVISVWPGAAPGTENKSMVEVQNEVNLPVVGKVLVKTAVNVPTISVIRPAPGKASRAAMLVLPGGGFGGLAWDLEGIEPAQWLAEHGITAFILKYRVGHLSLGPGQAPPKDMGEVLRLMEPGRVLAVADATQALKVVRGMAEKYDIDQNKVGMMGFSAGAIATLGVVLQAESAERPNFAVSVYGMPIINTQPAPDVPPLFLVHAQDDATVPADSSAKLFTMWQAVKRPVEVHIYSKGGHGFGMRVKDQPIANWSQALDAWLKSLGVLDPIDEAGTGSMKR